jgi:hypothetical protein
VFDGESGALLDGDCLCFVWWQQQTDAEWFVCGVSDETGEE